MAEMSGGENIGLSLVIDSVFGASSMVQWLALAAGD